MLRQFICFAGVGAVGTAVQYMLLVLLVQAVEMYVVTASTLGMVAGATVNYFLNHRITFRSDKPHREAMVKFFSVAAGGVLLNGLLMALLADIMGFYYLLAQLVATALVLVWNFLVNRVWTFRETHV